MTTDPTGQVGEVEATERTRLRREAERGVFDRDAINEIIDAAVHCHLGFVGPDGQPFVIPTIHARVGDQLYVHGSAASRMMRLAASGAPLCCTITHLDGLVVARSTFWSSMNYRSVVVLGEGRAVTDRAEKRAALDAIVERLLPGRTDEVRPSTPTELGQTKVIALGLTEASAKVRGGDPNDDPGDLDGDAWAGTLPLVQAWGAPQASANLAPGIAVPASVLRRAQTPPGRVPPHAE